MPMEAIADQFIATDKNFPEVSIVMLSLNEADTLAACIGKAKRALNEHNIPGEIIVADNGSTDESQAIARKPRAHVVKVREREDMAVPSWVASQGRGEVNDHGDCR
jgi:hypothetical protein